MRIVTRDEDLEKLFENYISAKNKLESAEEHLRKVEAELLAEMEAKRKKTVAVDLYGRVFTATYTQRKNTVIDEKGLRKALRAPVFDKYTKRVLDRKALERAMTDGDVDPMTVARFVDQVPGRTYLTYRVKDEDEAGDL